MDYVNKIKKNEVEVEIHDTRIEDPSAFATKAELADYVTKDDLTPLATKTEVAAAKSSLDGTALVIPTQPGPEPVATIDGVDYYHKHEFNLEELAQQVASDYNTRYFKLTGEQTEDNPRNQAFLYGTYRGYVAIQMYPISFYSVIFYQDGVYNPSGYESHAFTVIEDGYSTSTDRNAVCIPGCSAFYGFLSEDGKTFISYFNLKSDGGASKIDSIKQGSLTLPIADGRMPDPVAGDAGKLLTVGEDGQLEWAGGGTGGGGLIKTTMQELFDLKAAGELVPGCLYRIEDYAPTYSVPAYNEGPSLQGYRMAGHQFDIIVLAVSESEIAAECWFDHHEGDTYFVNSDLSKWHGSYVIEKLESALAIVGSVRQYGTSFTIGKVESNPEHDEIVDGQLYQAVTLHINGPSVSPTVGSWFYITENANAIWMFDGSVMTQDTRFTITSIALPGILTYGYIDRLIDERMNDCPYDFKNVLYESVTDQHDNVYHDVYTFGYYDTTLNTAVDKTIDASSNDVHNNVISYKTSILGLPSIIFFNDQEVVEYRSNIFGYDDYNMTFAGNTVCYNVFGNGCYANRFKFNLTSCRFGNNVHDISLTAADRCKFGDDIYQFDCSAERLEICEFGNSCNNIHLTFTSGQRVRTLKIGDNCQSLTISASSGTGFLKNVEIDVGVQNTTIDLANGGSVIMRYGYDSSGNLIRSDGIPLELPSATSADEGKVPTVNAFGQYELVTPSGGVTQTITTWSASQSELDELNGPDNTFVQSIRAKTTIIGKVVFVDISLSYSGTYPETSLRSIYMTIDANIAGQMLKINTVGDEGDIKIRPNETWNNRIYFFQEHASSGGSGGTMHTTCIGFIA